MLDMLHARFSCTYAPYSAGQLANRHVHPNNRLAEFSGLQRAHGQNCDIDATLVPVDGQIYF